MQNVEEGELEIYQEETRLKENTYSNENTVQKNKYSIKRGTVCFTI